MVVPKNPDIKADVQEGGMKVFMTTVHGMVDVVKLSGKYYEQGALGGYDTVEQCVSAHIVRNVDKYLEGVWIQVVDHKE